jgi:hypothetical protein
VTVLQFEEETRQNSGKVWRHDDKKARCSHSRHLIVICAHHLEPKYGHVQDGLNLEAVLDVRLF